MTRIQPARAALVLALLAAAALVAPGARGQGEDLYCEAPVTFFDAGWYYCEDPSEGMYFAAPAELLLDSVRRNWGVAIGCFKPPKWKIWEEAKPLHVRFFIPRTHLPTGTLTINVMSTTYTATAEIVEPDEDVPHREHITDITDPHDVARLLQSLENQHNINWTYPVDPDRTYQLGIITLPAVLRIVRRKCRD